MKTHVEAKKPAPPCTHATPVPHALANQTQLRSALLRAGVQPRLEVGAVNCPLEREADAAAERVMRMPEPLLSPPVSGRGFGGEKTTQASPQLESSLSSLSGGSPLDAQSLAFFEPRFGADFGQVRLHTDASAAQMAKSLNAKAFTLGNDIAFGANQYSAHTPAGRSLLGHELAHVVQQQGAQQGRVQGKWLQRKEEVSEEFQGTPNAVNNTKAKPELKPWLGNAPMETHGQVAIILQLEINSLKGDLSLASTKVKRQADEWIEWANGMVQICIQSKYVAERVDVYIPVINCLYDSLLGLRVAVHDDKLSQVKDELKHEREAATKAAKKAKALLPRMDDALRAAFRQGSHNTLREVASTVGSVISTGSDLHSLATAIADEIYRLPIAKDPKHWMYKPNSPQIKRTIGKCTEALGKINRGLSTLEVVLTVLDRRKRATEAEQGMKELSDAVTIITGLPSVLGFSLMPHFSIYTNFYLKPALETISKQIGVLVGIRSSQNRDFVQVTGNLLSGIVEPGGQEMFDLMVQVMHAKNDSRVPELPSGVKEYLFQHREKLSAGLSPSATAVPTEGRWMFQKYSDGPQGRIWLFTYRRDIWAMLYGSMPVPTPKQYADRPRP